MNEIVCWWPNRLLTKNRLVDRNAHKEEKTARQMGSQTERERERGGGLGGERRARALSPSLVQILTIVMVTSVHQRRPPTSGRPCARASCVEWTAVAWQPVCCVTGWPTVSTGRMSGVAVSVVVVVVYLNPTPSPPHICTITITYHLCYHILHLPSP